MNRINAIFYINLEKRKDRREELERQFFKLEIKAERYDAFPFPTFGILGCSISHRNVIQIAKDRDYQNVLILEDDCRFVLEREEIDSLLNKFFDNIGDNYDVLFLSYCPFQYENTQHDFLIKIKKSQTATAYLVNKRYYSKLLDIYNRSIPLLYETREHWNYANDIVWHSLQEKDDWYALVPIVAVQESGYSDNSRSFQDYEDNFYQFLKENLKTRIFIYGDSHALFSFRNKLLVQYNYYSPSVTMHRVGRDSQIPNFNPFIHDKESILVFSFGEVDCRCHVHRQLMAGREIGEVITSLTQNYIQTILKNIKLYKKIIIAAVPPPTRKNDYEKVNGPITHEFPFIGTDQERSLYTQMTNEHLSRLSHEYGFYFFDPYSSYKNEDGTLNFLMSDSQVHIRDNDVIIRKLKKLIYSPSLSNE